MPATLQSARESYQSASAAAQRLDRLRAELEPFRTQIEELAKVRAKEEKDVTRLESGSLTALFLNLFGKAEEKLTREREEALQAAVSHDAACAQLAALEVEIARLDAEARSLPALRIAYENLLYEKKQRLAADPACAEQLLSLETALSDQKRHLREVDEAIRAAKRALSTAEDALHELKEAESFGTWDVLGGGMLVDFAKHEHMDAAQEAINQLQSHLRLMRSELNDVRISADVQVKAEEFSKFLDFFWDNLFTDYSMLDRISSARSSIENVKASIQNTLSRLENIKSSSRRALQKAEDNLRTFIETQESVSGA